MAPFEDRANNYKKRAARAAKDNDVKTMPRIIFSSQERIPLRGRIALWLLRQVKARLVESVVDNAPLDNGNSQTTKRKLRH